MRSRSAHSLPLVSLFRIHCVWLERAPFRSAHSSVVLSEEDDGDDVVAVLRPVPRLVPRLVLRFVFSSRLILPRASSLRIVASRRRRSHLSRLPACLVPRPVKSSAPLSVASFASPIPSRSSLTTLVPSCVSSPVPFLVSSRLARCVEQLAAHLAVAPFYSARFFVLPMPCRHHRLTTG